VEEGEAKIGDISEIRGLVVVGSFLSCLVLLIGLIPADFYPTAYEGKTVSPPESGYFEAVDITYYVNTVIITLNDTGYHAYKYPPRYYTYELDLGGHDLRLYDYYDPDVQLKLEHFWVQWIFETNHHWMKWINHEGVNRGEELTPSELDADYVEGNIRYIVKCDHFQAIGFFGFNETAYSKPSEAWENNDLHIMFAIEFDQATTGFNAWSLISGILFFQLPDVHPIINATIAVPIWIAIVYISVILIYRSIGAIFGGGA